MDYNFYMPTQLFTGENCFLKNVSYIDNEGERFLIVTGLNSAKKSGVLTDIQAVLDKSQKKYVVFDKTEENPSFSTCQDAAKIAFDFQVDHIIGAGGGSVLDATKAISLLSKNLMWSESQFYTEKATVATPFSLIGTTAGTGSEVTDVAVITNSSGRKTSIRGNYLYAKYSFCDPKYTYTLPERQTVSTALDAFSHAFESYYSKAGNEISELFSLKAMAILYPILISVKQFKFSVVDRIMREDLLKASVFAGFAINQSGTCFPHPLGYFLTENYNLPHGLACATFLPNFIRWIQTEVTTEKNEKLLKVLKIKTFEELIELIEYYTHFEISLSDEEKNLLAQRVVNSRGVVYSPGKLDEDQLRKLLD